MLIFTFAIILCVFDFILVSRLKKIIVSMQPLHSLILCMHVYALSQDHQSH